MTAPAPDDPSSRPTSSTGRPPTGVVSDGEGKLPNTATVLRDLLVRCRAAGHQVLCDTHLSELEGHRERRLARRVDQAVDRLLRPLTWPQGLPRYAKDGTGHARTCRCHVCHPDLGGRR